MEIFRKFLIHLFLVTPTNVDISIDLQDLLGRSMETASVRGRYWDRYGEKLSYYW